MSSVNTKLLQKNQVAGNGLVCIPFRFAPNGTSDPVASTILGPGITSIVYTATATWTITLSSKYRHLLSHSFGVTCAGSDPAQGFKFEVDSAASDVTTGVIVLASVNSSGTRATIAAATNQRIHGTLWVTTSAVL